MLHNLAAIERVAEQEVIQPSPLTLAMGWPSVCSEMAMAQAAWSTPRRSVAKNTDPDFRVVARKLTHKAAAGCSPACRQFARQ